MPFRSSAGILERLPDISRGDVSLYLLNDAGELVRRIGPDDGFTTGGHAGPDRSPPPGRGVFETAVGQAGEHVVVTYDVELESIFEPFLEDLFQNMTEKDQLELDMESMYASSLALLEEVSMVGEVMTQLSGGVTDEEVAQIALEALLVAASVERAVYVRYDPSEERCEVLVQVVMDEETRKPTVSPYPGEMVFDAGGGLVGAALTSQRGAIMATVPADERLGARGSPEGLARREVIAVPVRYGFKHDVLTLGVLLVMDKRATSYSNLVQLGSQEGKMATAIASMVGSSLGNRLIAAFGKELKLANELQQQILPDRPAKVAGFDLAGRCETLGAVGGDYFDFLSMADERTLAVVADVSGHNLASGMVMVSARSALKLLASIHSAPVEVFDRLADCMFEDLSSTESFITAVGVALSPDAPTVEVVNAGHNDAMLFRAKSRRVQRLRSSGTVLGFLHGITYEGQQVTMSTGDVLLLYTDGVTEAIDATGRMFEEDRLKKVLKEAAGGSAQEILSAVYSAVAEFADTTDKGDDITAVVVKRTGEEEQTR